ncbi:MAG: hypothetical protein WCH46_04490 [bacterium]
MKLLLFSLLLTYGVTSFAQGGMGKLPREDVVMLSQVTRDSLADEMVARIKDLKRFALAGNLDSAAPLIAWRDSGKTGKWTHPCSLSNPDDATHAKQVLEKVKKMFTDFPDMHQEYFAVFKTKDTPSGQLVHFQINLIKGTKKRMVSFHYYPIGENLLFGDAN